MEGHQLWPFLLPTSGILTVTVWLFLIYMYILSRKKREAYRGSEFGPRILADNDIQVIMKVRRVVVFHFELILIGLFLRVE